MRRKSRPHRVLVCALIASAGMASADTIHVNGAAAPDGDGLTWATAFNDLQVALAAAQPGDEVWIAGGTYTPAGPGGDRNTRFDASGLTLRGGFVGAELSPEDRPAKDAAGAPVTVLSGDLNGDDDAEFGNREDNSFIIVFSQAASLELDRVTVRGASADSSDAPLLFAAAVSVLIPTSPVILSECEIADNQSAGRCAGVLIGEGVGVVIRGSIFRGNVARDIGALRLPSRTGAALCVLTGGVTVRGDLVIEDSRFIDNTVEAGLNSTSGSFASGGAVYYSNVALDLRGSLFFRNTVRVRATSLGTSGGAIGSPRLATSRSSLVQSRMSGCDFVMNRVVSTVNGFIGDAVGGAAFVEGPIDIDGCNFTDNQIEVTPQSESRAFVSGGALAIDDDIATPSHITGCDFTGNGIDIASVGDHSLFGAALSAGLSDLTNCRFVENQVTTAADTRPFSGLRVLGFALSTGGTMTNTVVRDNRLVVDATSEGVIGGAVDCSGVILSTIVNNTALGTANAGTVRDDVINSIIWNNRGDGGTLLEQQGITTTSSATYANSLIEGATPALGTGVFNADPRFIDAANGDYRLQPTSPAIDAGEALFLPPDLMTDLDNNPRIVDADGNGIARPDLGAFEFQGQASCNAADLAGIFGTLDLNDIIVFVEAFNANDPFADIATSRGGDGLLNVNDIITFVNDFSSGCP